MSDATKMACRQPAGAVRAFFAPVDRATGAVTQLDFATAFDMDAPPAPWVDLGAVRNFVRAASPEVETLHTGNRGTTRLRFRKSCDATVSVEFCEWGKLQMALASSSQHINVLETKDGATVAPVKVQAGSSATELVVGDAASKFAAGEMVAVDVDLETQRGFVGTGIAGTFVDDPLGKDSDLIRRVTFNVAQIAEVTPTTLRLQAPLVGGVPLSGAAVQKVVAFADREGPRFVQEWSALFVVDSLSGGRVAFYYPRLQTAAEAGESRIKLEEGIDQFALSAKFVALPVNDTLDGEQAVCYRCYWP